MMRKDADENGEIDEQSLENVQPSQFLMLLRLVTETLMINKHLVLTVLDWAGSHSS